MIYLFTGDNEYKIKAEVKKWKDAFIQKHGDFNLLHLKNLNKIEINFLSENILGGSFFGTSKLIIIDDVPTSAGVKDKKTLEISEYLLGVLDNIPDTNIVLFNSVLPDKRGKLYKKIKSLGELKEFINLKGEDLFNELNYKYSQLVNKDALKLLCLYKAENYLKIEKEIEKLSIANNVITKEIVQKNIRPELDISIFELIDLLLDFKGKKQILDKINIILESTNIYAFYNGLLSNLRFYAYIGKLKSKGFSSSEIKNNLNLGNKAWLLDKKRFNSSLVEKLYFDLIKIEKKQRSGNLLGSNTDDFRFEIDKVILSSFSN